MENSDSSRDDNDLNKSEILNYIINDLIISTGLFSEYDKITMTCAEDVKQKKIAFAYNNIKDILIDIQKDKNLLKKFDSKSYWSRGSFIDIIEYVYSTKLWNFYRPELYKKIIHEASIKDLWFEEDHKLPYEGKVVSCKKIKINFRFSYAEWDINNGRSEFFENPCKNKDLIIINPGVLNIIELAIDYIEDKTVYFKKDPLSQFKGSEKLVHEETVRSAKFSPDKSKIIICTEYFIYIWDTWTSKLIKKLALNFVGKDGGYFRDAQITPCGKILIVNSKKFVKIIDIEKEEILQTIEFDSLVKKLALDREGTHLAIFVGQNIYILKTAFEQLRKSLGYYA